MAVLPQTTLARVGLGIDVAAIAVFAALLVSGYGVGLGLPLFALALGAVLVLVAIVRRGERSLLAGLALLPGAFLLLALIAEITGLME